VLQGEEAQKNQGNHEHRTMLQSKDLRSPDNEGVAGAPVERIGKRIDEVLHTRRVEGEAQRPRKAYRHRSGSSKLFIPGDSILHAGNRGCQNAGLDEAADGYVQYGEEDETPAEARVTTGFDPFLAAGKLNE
jgi:hypothetical protein